MVPIVIADDHVVVREVFGRSSWRLETTDVGEAGSSGELLTLPTPDNTAVNGEKGRPCEDS